MSATQMPGDWARTSWICVNMKQKFAMATKNNCWGLGDGSDEAVYALCKY